MSDSDTKDETIRPEDIDPGEPLGLLAGLRVEPSEGFLARIRRALDRKVFASQVLDLAWFAPLVVLLEYVQVIAELLGPSRRGGNR